MKARVSKIIWVGSWFPVDNISSWRAASPAAMNWQCHLLSAMKKLGVDLTFLYFRAEPIWPRGRFLPGRAPFRPDLLLHPGNELQYINFPLFRTISFFVSTVLSVLALATDGRKNVVVVVTYNGPRWARLAMDFIRLFKSIRWICVVADDLAPNGADGYVFLSYGYYSRFQSQHKLHLDGGVYGRTAPSQPLTLNIDSGKKVFVYSGNFTKWSGIHILLDAIGLINRKDFIVLLSGPACPQAIIDRISRDSRIHYLGLLDPCELSKLYERADFFVNPRPTDITYGDNNFPSKLLDYLAWNKPILSTKTGGLSPNFCNNLELCRGTPEGFAEAIERALSSPDQLTAPSGDILSWDEHADRLISFVEEYVEESGARSVYWYSAHPTSYNDVLFDALGRQPDIDLEVVYKKKVLKSHPWKRALATGHNSSTYAPFLRIDWRSISRSLVDRKSYFIIAGWDHPTVILMLCILKLLGRNYAIWTDTPHLGKKRPYFKKIVREAWLKWIFSGAKYLLATGDIGCRNLLAMGADERNVVSLPFFLDLELYKRKGCSDHIKPLRFCSSGRLENTLKGHDLALRALALALSDYDGPWEYVIAGTGKDAEALNDLAKSLGIGSNVRMAGWLEPDELVKLYHSSAVVLHPSPSHDPFPNTVLEGMAASCVVMASDVSGSAVDRISSGFNGYLHSAGNWQMLAEQIKDFLKKLDQIGIVGARARSTAEEWPVERGVEVIRHALSK